MTPQVADKFAITEQIYRYCRSVDRLDVALGHTVFHPDSHADFGLYSGPGRGWIDFICEEHRKFLHHSHQVTNIVIDLAGDHPAAVLGPLCRRLVAPGRPLGDRPA
jgi:hypothetical protein